MYCRETDKLVVILTNCMYRFEPEYLILSEIRKLHIKRKFPLINASQVV